MIPFLLLNWRWLVPTAAAAALGLMLGFSRLEIVNLKSARAEERAAAAKLQLEALERAHEADNRNAELTSKLDSANAQYLESIEATRGDFERRLAFKLRERRSSCGDGVPGETPDPGGAAADAPRSDDGSGGADFDAGRRLRGAVKKLQADVVTCVEWAGQVGR